MQTTASVQLLVDPTRLRASGVDMVKARPATTAAPDIHVARGLVASSAHRLLGLGPDGAARLGQAQPALTNAFGGDPATWHQLGNPWIAARSLAQPTDSVSTQSTSAWLMASGEPGQRSGSRL